VYELLNSARASLPVLPVVTGAVMTHSKWAGRSTKTTLPKTVATALCAQELYECYKLYSIRNRMTKTNIVENSGQFIEVFLADGHLVSHDVSRS